MGLGEMNCTFVEVPRGSEGKVVYLDETPIPATSLIDEGRKERA